MEGCSRISLRSSAFGMPRIFLLLLVLLLVDGACKFLLGVSYVIRDIVGGSIANQRTGEACVPPDGGLDATQAATSATLCADQGVQGRVSR